MCVFERVACEKAKCNCQLFHITLQHVVWKFVTVNYLSNFGSSTRTVKLRNEFSYFVSNVPVFEVQVLFFKFSRIENELVNFVPKFASSFQSKKHNWQFCKELLIMRLKSNMKLTISKWDWHLNVVYSQCVYFEFKGFGEHKLPWLIDRCLFLVHEQLPFSYYLFLT